MGSRWMQKRWLAAVAMFAGAGCAEGQLAWDAVGQFRYGIDKVSVTTVTSSSWTVKVIFSVANPAPSAAFPDAMWDIKTATPFAGATLRVLVGWDPAEYQNTNSRGNLNPVPTGPSSVGAALPVSVNALTGGQPCTAATCAELGAIPLTGRYFVQTTVSPMGFTAITSGVAAIEGRAVCPLSGPVLPGCPTANGVAVAANIPVTSVAKAFSFTGGAVTDRRKVVDIAKCKGCHDNQQHGDTVVPRLSLHGGNRNEAIEVCVICHNPNQTDIPFRTSGAEESIDFKRMVHGIHAGEFRKSPLAIVGFQGNVVDFSHVKFPSELRNCLKCHIEGTYQLPLTAKALGSTVNTKSAQATATTLRTVDVDPANDLRITPTAATCSGCHGEREARDHMVRTGGASFATLQQNIVPGVTERCVNCHGPGRVKDVRRVHELSR